jgi:hypothetical protein
MLNQPIDWLLLRLVKGLILLQLLASLAGSGSFVSAFAQAQPARPFNMISLGDSIMWGQGLPENMKFRTLVANWLQSQYGSSRTVVQWPTHAHSGAVTGWGLYPTETCPSPQNCSDPDAWYRTNPPAAEHMRLGGLSNGDLYPGEVPFGYLSISAQIGMTVNDLKGRIDPADVDLVLLDGGINDVSVASILDVSATEHGNGPLWVRRRAEALCVGHMKSLLPQVLSQFPNAVIVVTGYFPIVSESSDLNEVAKFLEMHFHVNSPDPRSVGGDPFAYIDGVRAASLTLSVPVRAAMAARSQAWAQTALSGLTDLVNQTNQGLTTPRVALAWPNFSDDNAYAAPNTLLFKLGEFLSDEMRGSARQSPPGDWSTPQGVAYYRGQNCAQYDFWDALCYEALLGHPNPAGAQAYANAIINVLDREFNTKLAFPSWPQLSAKASIIGRSLPLTVALTITDATSKQPVPGTQVWVQDGFGRAQSSGTTAADGTVRLSFTPCPQSYSGPHLLPSSVPSPACPIYGTVAKYGMLNSWTPALAATASVTTANALSVSVSDPLTKTNAAGAVVSVVDSLGHAALSVNTGPDGTAKLDLSKACSQGYLVQCKANVIVSKAGYLSCSFAVPSSGREGNCQYSPFAGATPLPSIAGVVAVAPNSTTAVRPNAGLTAQQLQVQLPALSASVCPTLDGKSCALITARPPNSALMDIVTVTSGGAAVPGATVSVSGQPTQTFTVVTNANGVAVITHLPCFAPGVVPKIGQTTAPIRTPVSCGATVSKAAYQSFNTSLP